MSRRKGRAQHAQLIAALRTALPEAQLMLMTMSPASGPRGVIRARLAGHYSDVVDLAHTQTLAAQRHPRTSGWFASR